MPPAPSGGDDLIRPRRVPECERHRGQDLADYTGRARPCAPSGGSDGDSLSRFAVRSGPHRPSRCRPRHRWSSRRRCARGPAPPDPGGARRPRSRRCAPCSTSTSPPCATRPASPIAGACSAWPTRPTASRRRPASLSHGDDAGERSTGAGGIGWRCSPSATATSTRRCTEFDRAIALSPDFVPARWRRGLLLLDRGDLDGAEAAFRGRGESRAQRLGRRPPGWPAC